MNELVRKVDFVRSIKKKKMGSNSVIVDVDWRVHTLLLSEGTVMNVLNLN